MRVFWSWQSDHSAKVCHYFVRDCLNDALCRVQAELELEEALRLDHDTKGEPGLAPIADTILRKIDEAVLFVGDLTPIAKNNQKYVANPNVLLELGYAKKALTPGRIILVWNTAFEGCTPESLPFDLKHRRAPIAYCLPEDADAEEIKRVRAELTRVLANAIGVCLPPSPGVAPVDPPAGHPSRPGDPSAWFGASEIMRVRDGTYSGVVEIEFVEEPRAYGRVIPAVWPVHVNADTVFDLQGMRPPFLGDIMGYSFGSTADGLLRFHAESRDREPIPVRAATQWFSGSGEIWSVAPATWPMDEKVYLSIDWLLKGWRAFFSECEQFMKAHGAAGSYRVIAGVNGIQAALFGAPPTGREIMPVRPSAHFDRVFPKIDEAARRDALLGIAGVIMRAYGLSPMGESELIARLEGGF